MSSLSPDPVWTIEAVLRWAADDFRSRGIDTPRLDAELLLSLARGTTRLELIVDSKRVLAPEELSRMRAMVRRRRSREPMAYILGEREFYGRSFRVDRRVMVPRPDTETLVEVSLERTRPLSMCMRALDLCTGSGCVAITLARERPTSFVVAADASEDALAMARENVLRLGAYNVVLLAGDLFGALRHSRFALSTESRFDLVTANPPYIASGDVPGLMPEVREFEPSVALDGGPDGLSFVRRIISGAAAHLVAPGGVLALEIGAEQAPAVAALFEQAGYGEVDVRRDYGRIERVVSGVLRTE